LLKKDGTIRIARPCPWRSDGMQCYNA